MISGIKYHDKTQRADHFPLSAGINRIPLDVPCVPMHVHGEMEIIRIRKGTGTVTVDLDRYPVKADSIVLVLPHRLHSIEVSSGETLEYEDLVFDLSMLYGASEDLCTRDYLIPMTEGKAPLPVILEQDYLGYSSFLECFEDTLNLARFFPAGFPLAIKSRLLQMLYILFYHEPVRVRSQRPFKSTEKIRQALNIIAARYPEKLSLQIMADELGITAKHFSDFFASAVGMTFVQYLNDYRLMIAAQLLAEGELSVSEAAEKAGFGTPSHFRRMFKNRFGKLPGAYRQENLQSRPSR